MEHPKKPSIDLARRTLSEPLLKAIEAIFASTSDGCCLVGGTALAGFYAAHRRSDDIDLFTKDSFAQAECVSSVLALETIGVKLSGQRRSAQHFHCLAELENHKFTIDIVLDTHFLNLAELQTRVGDIRIATLEGLLAMKIATLVSRCSEKDLFDLNWLFENYRRPSYSEFVTLGGMIDTGVGEESILISLSGSSVRESACHFSEDFGVSAKEVYEISTTLREKLIIEYSSYVKTERGYEPLKALLKKLR